MTSPRPVGGGALPEAVRRRVVEVAAERLGAMPVEEVPQSLRPFQRFTPARRRQVVLPLTTALETDEGFRTAVADGVREALPELVAAIEAGADVATVDPDDVAAVAYLLRVPGWPDLVARAAEREAAAVTTSAAAAAERAALAAERAATAATETLEARVAAAESKLARAGEDVDRERRQAREASERARRAEAQVAGLNADLEAIRAQLASADATAVDAGRRAAGRVAELEDALERGRRDSRESREAASARTWLLLDTLARAVSGLREELSPGPAERRPADLVAAGLAAGVLAAGMRDGGGLSPAPEDPATVDLLLGLPQAHLIVDGYNVTKAGFPDVPLEDQRNRLIAGLGALAARTGAEITCVFDGAEVQVRVPATGGPSRRVRVLFSPPGEIADEVIKRLVRAEPIGRVVVVCSADREVVDDTIRAGARVVAPQALLTRLGRG
jgi:predicted RNA-binding protein with PIN domain